MKKLILLFIILFSYSAWSKNISFKKNIVVGGQPSVSVKLIDVITPSASVAKSMGMFSGINFVNIKKLETIELSRREIVNQLRQIKAEHKELRELNFVVPQKIKITHLGYNLNTRVVVESLKRNWSKQCSNCKFIVDSVLLPELSSEYKDEPWFIQSSSSLPRGRFSAQIIYANVANPSSIWITGQAQTKKPVAVVSKNIAKGDFILGPWIQVKYRDIGKVRGSIVNIENLENKVTNKYLMSGDIIKSVNLSDKIIFRRGDAVKLIYLAGGVRIVTTAVSDSIGKVGKQAWVKNLKSKKRISGVVLKTGEVLVQ